MEGEVERAEASEALLDKLEEFLRLFYSKEIKELGRKYPKQKSLIIDFKTLEEFDYELADRLLNEPDVVLEGLEKAVHRIEVPGTEKVFKPAVRITNLPEDRIMLIRDIGSEHIGKMVAVEGVVRQITTVLPKIKIATWECVYCGRVYHIPQEGTSLEKPSFYCSCDKRNYRVLEDKSVWTDFQKIQIQEPLEKLKGGEQARYLDIHLEDDLVNRVYPGDRVLVVGILRLRAPEGRRTVYGKYIEAVYIEPVQKEFEELEPTEEEVQMIKELASSPDIYDKLVRSIAPTIYGHEKIKEAIALQLFGGVKKEMPDGTKIRGNIHILLMGDPGTGKSQLLQYASRIAPKSFYVAGKTTTGAGLSASAEKDEFGEGGWVIKAGVLVLASGGLAAVDEFEKIDSKDRGALLEAMEQQTVSVAKAGIVTTFKAETSILAAANPKFGRFDPYENPLTQINIEPPILSRFDLMFIVREVIDENVDREVAKHIMKTHKAGEMWMQYHRSTDTKLTGEDVEKEVEWITPEIDVDLLRKYIAYARSNVFPVLSDEAIDEIENFYITLRKAGKEMGAVSATPRQLEALVRLAEASARVRLSDVVTRDDARRAIELVKASMEEVLKDRETGVIDYDVLTTGKTKSVREKMRIVLNTLIHWTEEFDAMKEEDLIEEVESNYGIPKDEVREIIERLKKEGEIYEPKHGFLKPATKY